MANREALSSTFVSNNANRLWNLKTYTSKVWVSSKNELNYSNNSELIHLMIDGWSTCWKVWNWKKSGGGGEWKMRVVIKNKENTWGGVLTLFLSSYSLFSLSLTLSLPLSMFPAPFRSILSSSYLTENLFFSQFLHHINRKWKTGPLTAPGPSDKTTRANERGGRKRGMPEKMENLTSLFAFHSLLFISASLSLSFSLLPLSEKRGRWRSIYTFVA